MKTVTITDQNGQTTPTMFRDGDTLGDLLSHLRFNTDNVLIKVNDEPETLDYELEDGDDVELSAKQKISGAA